MKYRVDSLEGALLDAAVAKAETGRPQVVSPIIERPMYSCLWSDGGPIIERERMSLAYKKEAWIATWKRDGWAWADEAGTTTLIAAMRAYVASKLGDEVELP
jgi:hypothetical protein